mgnify:CR=1 FL=1
MINTFSKQSYKYFSLIILALIIFSLVILFFDNAKLNEINSLEELTNQEINCNQHYWTLKNRIDDFGDYDVSVVHKDIYIFPEIENIFCLGKAVEVISDGNFVYVVSGINQKVFVYICVALFLSFIILFQLFDNEKILIVSLWVISLIFIQLYLFSSFRNPLINFINLIILVMLVVSIIESFRQPKLKQINLMIYLFCIVICSVIFLKYIYFDYVIYLSVGAFILLKSLQKLLNLDNADIGYLILISHIGLILGGIDYPLSRNHINYFPSIFFDFDNSYFSDHYSKNMIFPYPVFAGLTKFIINLFGITSVNFLNYVSYFFGLLIVFVFVKSVIGANWKNVCLIFTLISGRLTIYSFFKDTGWDKNVYENSFIKSGIGEGQLLTHLFQPTTFDVLILLVIVFLINKNFFAANLISFISIILHTYNVVPIFLIYLSYLITDKNSLIEVFHKFKNSFLLILSLPIVFFTNIISLSSSRQSLIEADNIMSNIRIPMHRSFSGSMSLLGRSNNEVVIDLFENNFIQGFHFEIEFVIFTVILIFLIKNPMIKNINILIFLMTFSTIFYTHVFQDSIVSVQIRNAVPWRTSTITYLFALIYVSNYLTSRFYSKKFSFFISSLILYGIFSLSVLADINDTRLRESLEDYGNLYNGRNLINPNDNFIIFGTSNSGNQNSFSFISTTQNYYGHPYKSSEIVDWYQSINNINNFFESMPDCEKFSEFIAITESNRAIFSSIDYVPKSITNCENLIKEDYLGYYVFENSK